MYFSRTSKVDEYYVGLKMFSEGEWWDSTRSYCFELAAGYHTNSPSSFVVQTVQPLGWPVLPEVYLWPHLNKILLFFQHFAKSARNLLADRPSQARRRSLLPLQLRPSLRNLHCKSSHLSHTVSRKRNTVDSVYNIATKLLAHTLLTSCFDV